jgi:hypothetical protein
MCGRGLLVCYRTGWPGERSSSSSSSSSSSPSQPQEVNPPSTAVGGGGSQLPLAAAPGQTHWLKVVRKARHLLSSDLSCSTDMPLRGLVRIVATQAVFLLFASCRDTGLGMVSGNGILLTVPFFGSDGLPNAFLRFGLVGWDFSGFVLKICTEQGFSFTTTAG